MPAIPPSARSAHAPEVPSAEEVFRLSALAQRLYRDWERLPWDAPERPRAHAAYRAADREWVAALRAREDAERAAAGLPPRAPEPTYHHTIPR